MLSLLHLSYLSSVIKWICVRQFLYRRTGQSSVPSLTLVLLRGVVPTPQWFSPWCSKSHSQGVKLLRVPSSSSFPFILAKNSEPTNYTGVRVSFQSWEVGVGWCDPVIFELDILKIFEVICTHKFVCKLEGPFSNIFCKNSHENRMFLRFFT